MLIKVHVPRRDDPMGHGIIAAIALGVSRVTKKDTRDGTGSEFVRGGGSNTGVTMTTEDHRKREGNQKGGGVAHSSSEYDTDRG
jgi:hypothetical protein